MKLIAKYLKPFVASLLICVAVLFVQVIAELELPNQMSDLVNTGIQSQGIKEGTPSAVSAQAMTLLRLYASQTDQAVLDDGYKLVATGSEGASQQEQTYPLVQQSDIYVLNSELGQDRLLQVEQAYQRSAYALTLSLQDMGKAAAENEGTEAQSAVNDTEGTGAREEVQTPNIEDLYALLPMLQQQEEAGGFAPYIEAASKDVSLVASQVGLTFTALFYKELGVDLGNVQQNYIMRTGLLMLGIALLSVIASITVGWFSTKIATTISGRMRFDVYKKVNSFSSTEFDSFSTASLITRTTNDVQQIQQVLVMGIRMVFYAPLMGIGGMIMAVKTSPSLSWIIAVAVVALAGLILIMFSLAMPKFKIIQTLIDKLNLVSRENLSGMMVIRAFGNEGFEEKRFEKANENLRAINRFIQRLMSFMMPAMTLIMNLVTLLIIWVASHAIANSTLQIGDMMAFIQYIMQIIIAFLLLSMMFIMIPRALVSANRIKEVLDTEPVIKDTNNPKPHTHAKGVIVFDHVSFRYKNAEEDVLQDISFEALPGQTTAFIGSTGSGKSTIINLIPRLYDVTEGRITLDGVDIREMTQEDLRSQIGYVPQKGVLFSGDIASNIRYGKEHATTEELEQAIEVAQAKEFLEKLDTGLGTEISQGGTNVSGGQRQRISIARALVKQPPVYIFDDSFSALDLKTDARLRAALATHTSAATMLIVAQRVSTIMDAEQIIVLDKGRVVGKGTHTELLESCTEYREIAESQLSKEELA